MRIYIILCLVSNIFFYNAYAQKIKIDKVNENQKKYVYVDTLKTYERVAEKGYRSVEMFKKMGDGYYSNSELNKATRWYCELFHMTNKLESKYFLRYAECLKLGGENEEAKKIIEIFNKKSKDVKVKI